MDNHSRNLVLFSALLAGIAGFSGIARAELNEPEVPVQEAAIQQTAIQPPIKAYRPMPLPMARPGPHASVVVHRPSPAPVRAVAAILPPRSHCAWFECNQFVIVGIGF
jgi:hypothetical protein